MFCSIFRAVKLALHTSALGTRSLYSYTEHVRLFFVFSVPNEERTTREKTVSKCLTNNERRWWSSARDYLVRKVEFKFQKFKCLSKLRKWKINRSSDSLKCANIYFSAWFAQTQEGNKRHRSFTEPSTYGTHSALYLYLRVYICMQCNTFFQMAHPSQETMLTRALSALCRSDIL